MVLILLDILTISAVPRPTREVSDDIPVHYRDFTDETDYKNFVYQETIESYDKKEISGINNMPAGVRIDSQDDLFVYQSPENTRIQLSVEHLHITDANTDYISVYAGSPKLNFLSQAMKNTGTLIGTGSIKTSSFIQQLNNQGLSWIDGSRRNAGFKRYTAHQMNTIMSDTNKLLVKFVHPGAGQAQDGNPIFSANVKIIENDVDNNNHMKRDGSSGGPSFFMCNEDDTGERYQANTPNHYGTEGSITSHSKYAEEDMMVDEICKVRLSTDAGMGINLKFVNWDFQHDGEDSSNECDESFARLTYRLVKYDEEGKEYMEPSQHVCAAGQPNREYAQGLNLESDTVEFEFATGEDASAGFELAYLAYSLAVMTSEDEETTEVEDGFEDVPKVVKAGKIDTAGNVASEEVDTVTTPMVIQEQTAASSMSTQMPKMFSVIIIGVGIAMVMLIGIAGFTAWYRTRQQDELIEKLTDQLANLESQYSGSSNVSSNSSDSEMIVEEQHASLIGHHQEMLTVKVSNALNR